MAHTLSAKKHMRQNVKRRARNRHRKSQIKQAIRQCDSALHSRKSSEAAELLKTAYKHLDRAAAKGALHKNAAARKKARLAKRLAAAAKSG